MICQVHDMSFVVKSKFKHAVSCKPIVSGLKVPEEEISEKKNNMVFLYCLLISCAFGGIFAATFPPIVIPTTCIHNGTTYPTGPFRPSPCETCTCYSGQAMCITKDCGPPACVDSVRQADQCCPVCPNGPNCDYKGHTIQMGEIYTDAYYGVTCWCDDGPYGGRGPMGPIAGCRYRID